MARGGCRRGAALTKINPAGSRSPGAAHLRIASCQISTGPRSRGAPGARQSGGWSLPKSSRLPRPGPGTWLRPRGVVAGPARRCQPRSPLPEPAGGRRTSAGTWHHPPWAALLHHALVSGFIFIYLFIFIIFFPRDPRVEVAPGPTRCDGRWSRGHAAPRASQRGAVPGSGARCGAKHRDAAVPRRAGF